MLNLFTNLIFPQNSSKPKTNYLSKLNSCQTLKFMLRYLRKNKYDGVMLSNIPISKIINEKEVLSSYRDVIFIFVDKIYVELESFIL